MMSGLYCLIVALAYYSLTFGRDDHGDDVKTVKVTAGEPLILSFDYSGPTSGVSYDFTMDGKRVAVDNMRIFKQLGKLYYTEVHEHDSGEYRFTVIGGGSNFEKKIILSG